MSAQDLKACIFIDYMPRPIAAKEGDWAEFSNAMEVGEFVNAVIYNFRETLVSFFPTMMKREMTEEELNWFVDQILKTPTYVAALLGIDSSFADYSDEVRKIDGKIPVLNIVSEWYEGWAESAQKLLKKNTPNSEIVVLGKHLMFYEFPDEFNTAVDNFLATIK